MNDLMIDIETLGTGANSLVVSIGAVLFDPKEGIVGPKFYRVLSYQDQINKGRVPSESTIKFWFSQEKEPQKIFLEEGIPTAKVLNDLRQFILENTFIDTVRPWGNGPSFDLTILESLYEDFNIEHPWKFWNVRCYRTFRDYIYDGKDLPRKGVYHNAVDDCLHQISVITEGVKRHLVK